MGVDPKRDCRVKMAQPGGDDMNGDAREQQGRRVKVSQIVQPRVR